MATSLSNKNRMYMTTAGVLAVGIAAYGLGRVYPPLGPSAGTGAQAAALSAMAMNQAGFSRLTSDPRLFAALSSHATGFAALADHPAAFAAMSNNAAQFARYANNFAAFKDAALKGTDPAMASN